MQHESASPHITPFIIAHRGGADHRPENSLAAFAHALESEADGIECDIQLSRDGQLVIHHDLHLNPSQTRLNGAYITPPLPSIADLDYADLRRYDIGRLDPSSDYGKTHPDQMAIDNTPIPLFADLCDLLADSVSPDFKIIVEMKSTLDTDITYSQNIPDALCALLKTHPAAKKLAPQMIFISFDWRLVLAMKKLCPAVQYGFLTIPFAITDPDQPPPDLPLHKSLRQQSEDGAAWAGGFDWRHQNGNAYDEKILQALVKAAGDNPKWFVHWRDVTPARIAYALSLNIDIGVWTLNDADLIKEFIKNQVRYFITDNPSIRDLII